MLVKFKRNSIALIALYSFFTASCTNPPSGSNGDGGNNGTPEDVEKPITEAISTTLTIENTPVVAGLNEPVTFTAVITPAQTLNTIPLKGFVTFRIDNQDIPGCSSVDVDAAATASCRTQFASAGQYTLVATYSGSEPAYKSSQNSAVYNVSNSHIELNGDFTSKIVDSTQMLDALVTSTNNLSPLSGNIEFWLSLNEGAEQKIDFCPLAPPTFENQALKATCGFVLNDAGRYAFFAKYVDSNIFNSTQSMPKFVTVQKHSTKTELTAQGPRDISGLIVDDIVTFTATISHADAVSTNLKYLSRLKSELNGKVIFKYGETKIGEAQVTNGRASYAYTIPDQYRGISIPITAVYAGDDKNEQSPPSNAVTLVISNELPDLKVSIVSNGYITSVPEENNQYNINYYQADNKDGVKLILRVSGYYDKENGVGVAKNPNNVRLSISSVYTLAPYALTTNLVREGDTEVFKTQEILSISDFSCEQTWTTVNSGLQKTCIFKPVLKKFSINNLLEIKTPAGETLAEPQRTAFTMTVIPQDHAASIKSNGPPKSGCGLYGNIYQRIFDCSTQITDFGWYVNKTTGAFTQYSVGESNISNMWFLVQCLPAESGANPDARYCTWLSPEVSSILEYEKPGLRYLISGILKSQHDFCEINNPASGCTSMPEKQICETEAAKSSVLQNDQLGYEWRVPQMCELYMMTGGLTGSAHQESGAQCEINKPMNNFCMNNRFGFGAVNLPGFLGSRLWSNASAQVDHSEQGYYFEGMEGSGSSAPGTIELLPIQTKLDVRCTALTIDTLNYPQ